MLKYLLLLALALTLSGCYSAQAIKIGVDKYCGMTDTTERMLIKERINKELAPRSIAVYCGVW